MGENIAPMKIKDCNVCSLHPNDSGKYYMNTPVCTYVCLCTHLRLCTHTFGSDRTRVQCASGSPGLAAVGEHRGQWAAANCSPNQSRTEVSLLCVSLSAPTSPFYASLKSSFDHLNGLSCHSNYIGMLAVLVQRPLGRDRICLQRQWGEWPICRKLHGFGVVFFFELVKWRTLFKKCWPFAVCPNS